MLIQQAGRINSLAQTLLKYTAPGVPDLYQGSELWDLSLVDPDNRRPVDYEQRHNFLKELYPLPAKEAATLAMQRMDDGLPKLWTIHRALQLRKQQPAWFGADAAYQPLPVEGSTAQYAVAYLRGDAVITIVPRLSMTLGEAWDGTTVDLPKGMWTHQLTGAEYPGGKVEVETLLHDFPVALLTRKDQDNA